MRSTPLNAPPPLKIVRQKGNSTSTEYTCRSTSDLWNTLLNNARLFIIDYLKWHKSDIPPSCVALFYRYNRTRHSRFPWRSHGNNTDVRTPPAPPRRHSSPRTWHSSPASACDGSCVAHPPSRMLEAYIVVLSVYKFKAINNVDRMCSLIS